MVLGFHILTRRDVGFCHTFLEVARKVAMRSSTAWNRLTKQPFGASTAEVTRCPFFGTGFASLIEPGCDDVMTN
jgi:hypothetical protein